jgi:hypothetical protein
MESDMGKIADSIDAKVNTITDDKATESLSEQIASLHEQVSALVAREPIASSAEPSVGAEKLMVDISAQLEELCKKLTVHAQSSVSQHNTSPHQYYTYRPRDYHWRSYRPYNNTLIQTQHATTRMGTRDTKLL